MAINLWTLPPDQVKAYLVGTTQPYGGDSGPVLPDPIADGSGLLDASDATTSASKGQPVRAANSGLRPSDGFARAMYPVLYGTPLFYNASVIRNPSISDARLLSIRYLIVPTGLSPPLAGTAVAHEGRFTL